MDRKPGGFMQICCKIAIFVNDNYKLKDHEDALMIPQRVELDVITCFVASQTIISMW